MKLAMFVNDVEHEKPQYTTTRLALAATGRGHEVWYVGAGDFTADPDDTIRAQALRVPRGHTDRESLLASRVPERINVDELDVLWLRSDPADDLPDRAWAQNAGILFGGLAAERGVLVVNDPAGLALASNKLYLNHFPAQVRPQTLITRDIEQVRAFVDSHDGAAVVKPLQGSGGHGVFVLSDADANLEQMAESILRDGYLIGQQKLPDAAGGDVRMFLLEGRPLQVGDDYAAFRRVPADGELRSNMSRGASIEPVTVDETMLRLVDLVGPRLIQDGMFLVGLDIVGDRLLEINVFSPGGLGSAQQASGADFTGAVLDALEAKVGRRAHSARPGAAS
ncbi:MAG: glutathione synthase [Sporichthyaceae bacterium]